MVIPPRSIRPLRVAALFLAPLLAVAADKEILDFTHLQRNMDGTTIRSYEYAFGDWGDNAAVQVDGRGLLVNNAGSKGGVGENGPLDFRKHSKARVAYVIGNRNRAENFGFTLEDKDGTNQTFNLPLQGQPVGEPLAVTLDLTKPSHETEPGKKPGLDLKRLRSWQIRGNWQNLPVEVLVLKVWAVD